ncbi:MAG: hypothetical protein ACI9ON_001616 [Limisphaerales bacterium]|jgi:hypothetical protein
MKRIWLLRLVPTGRFGRWWCALYLFLFVAALIWLPDYLKPQDFQIFSWPIGLFFCVIISYIIPVFHFVSSRTEESLRELIQTLRISDDRADYLCLAITHKSTRWRTTAVLIGFAFWVLQTWIITGSADFLIGFINNGIGYVLTTIVPLLVWITTIVVITCLTDNARLFRTLSRDVEVDLFNTTILNPFGRMAVSSTLVVIGAQASFSIMWLDSSADPWTTIPGLVATTVAMIFMFFPAVWPIHKALKTAKQAELRHVQQQIDELRYNSSSDDYAPLAPLLAVRREVASIREWPFDISMMARLSLYLIIVPLTWIGAALIENLVDLFVS